MDPAFDIVILNEEVLGRIGMIEVLTEEHGYILSEETYDMIKHEHYNRDIDTGFDLLSCVIFHIFAQSTDEKPHKDDNKNVQNDQYICEECP